MILKDGRPESAWLEDYPAYAVAQAYRVQRHALDDALREIGLTTPQWGTLECIAKNENISGADMARLYHLTPQTMNTVLQNLEHADLIRREHHPAHGTVLLIRLTDAGRERLEEARSLVLSVQERMLSSLEPEERATLVRLLNRCVASLASEGGSKALYPDEA